jgi:hypothetical protein
MKAPTKTPAPPKRDTAQCDELTLALEQADALAFHLADRLLGLSDAIETRELYALSLIALAITDRHALILKTASGLFATGGAK